MARKKAVIHFQSLHKSGNIFWIMGAVRTQMLSERRHTDWNNAYERIGNSTSYEEALAILRELVDLIDDDGRY